MQEPQKHKRGRQSTAGVLLVVSGMFMEDVVITGDFLANIRWQETSVLSVAEAEKDF